MRSASDPPKRSSAKERLLAQSGLSEGELVDLVNKWASHEELCANIPGCDPAQVRVAQAWSRDPANANKLPSGDLLRLVEGEVSRRARARSVLRRSS